MAKREEVNVYCVSTGSFRNSREMAPLMEDILKQHKKENVLFIFGEHIMGPVARGTGRRIARDIHRVLKSHGKAWAAYSLGERLPDGNVVPTGYLVKPDTKREDGESDTGYRVYTKKSSFSNRQKLTGFDEKFMQTSTTADRIERNREKIIRLGERQKGFPRVTIGGNIVELRVCADAIPEEWGAQGKLEKDPLPSAKGKPLPHLLAIPAHRLDIDIINPREIFGLTRLMKSNGLALTVDTNSPGIVHAIKRRGKRPQKKAVDPFVKPETHGKFRVRHI